MVARYNADLANNFGNLANRVLNMAVSYCGGVVPDTRADGPLVDAGGAAFDETRRDGMTQLDFSDGFGAVWDLIRAANSYIEDRQPWALNKAGDAAATAAVLGDCLEALRIVALLASPVIPRAAAELWRRLGLPGRPEDARLPDAAAWGGLPAGHRRSRRARRCSPASTDVTAVDGRGGSTSHCHLPWLDRRRPTPSARPGPRPRGVERMVCVGTDLASSRAAIELAARHADVCATVGLHPHDASRLDDEWDDLVALAATIAAVVAVGEAGLRPHYEHSPRDEQERRVPRADRARAASSTARS